MNTKKAAHVSGFRLFVFLHHVLPTNIEKSKDAEYQNGVLFPTAHLNLVAKCANEDCHLQSMHDEQKSRHDVQRNGRFAREGHKEVEDQYEPDEGDGCFSQYQ
jgi:hypothetical protein